VRARHCPRRRSRPGPRKTGAGRLAALPAALP
jgi:hypothetical protein